MGSVLTSYSFKEEQGGGHKQESGSQRKRTCVVVPRSAAPLPRIPRTQQGPKECESHQGMSQLLSAVRTSFR